MSQALGNSRWVIPASSQRFEAARLDVVYRPKGARRGLSPARPLADGRYLCPPRPPQSAGGARLQSLVGEPAGDVAPRHPSSALGLCRCVGDATS